MKIIFSLLSCLFVATSYPILLQAQDKPENQTAPSHTTMWETYRDRQTFLVVNDGNVVFANGDWDGNSKLRKYAGRHPGTYVVYTSKGEIHRIDDAAAIRTLSPLIATVNDLAAQQSKLSARQEPLARQQADLSKKMNQTSTPREMTEIGSRQSEIGQQQAAVGREQGRIGEQQGVAGRQAYDEVRKLIDRCEEDKTCPTVVE